MTEDWLAGTERFAPRFVAGARIAVVAARAGWVVVDKPAGLLTVPGRGPERADCVERQVREAFPEAELASAVHRLDLETSGLVCVALARTSLVALSRAFEQRAVRKQYTAIVAGKLPAASGWIDAPIGPGARPRFAVDPAGRAARTHYAVLAETAGTTRVLLTPETGRTHQLRLHCAHLGAPILGDSLYGDPASADRLMLHACRLELPGEELAFERPAPF